MGLRPLEIFNFFQCEDRLYTSESDVYRRQILTYKDGPRTERVDSGHCGRCHPGAIENRAVNAYLRLIDDGRLSLALISLSYGLVFF